MNETQNTTAESKDYSAFHAALQRWYQRHGRHELQWRKTADPYRIYLSEVMLQQTQVETVLKRFYSPFLEKFPTLRALAKASEEEVLKAWQGLGYYSRARNLHKAAKECGGTLPDSVDELMALPGIGKNTAHAVAAFAFRKTVPVMEANVKRVLHRIFAKEKASDKELFDLAASLLDETNPFDYNQAMMDLGSMVCTPTSPTCLACPASGICAGKDDPLKYPAPKVKKEVPVRKLNILVLRDSEGRIFAEPRTTRFLNAMYHFREQDCEKPLPADSQHLGNVSHAYSHFRLEGEVYLVQQEERAKGNSWYRLEELERLPHTRTEAKILKLLKETESICNSNFTAVAV